MLGQFKTSTSRSDYNSGKVSLPGHCCQSCWQFVYVFLRPCLMGRTNHINKIPRKCQDVLFISGVCSLNVKHVKHVWGNFKMLNMWKYGSLRGKWGPPSRSTISLSADVYILSKCNISWALIKVGVLQAWTSLTCLLFQTDCVPNVRNPGKFWKQTPFTS